MDHIIIHAGFHPETPRTYQGEKIYRVMETRTVNGSLHYYLEHGIWVRDWGNEKYTTDSTKEERWGRVEQVSSNGARTELGFMILRVDRARGLL